MRLSLFFCPFILSERPSQPDHNHTRPDESDKSLFTPSPAETIAPPLAYTRSTRYNTASPLVVDAVSWPASHRRTGLAGSGKPKPTMNPTAGDRGTLAPLPEYHRRGLTVLTAFSVLSFISTTCLWLFITYKLVAFRWHRFRQGRRQKRRGQGRGQGQGQGQEQVEIRDPDFSLGLDQRHENLGGRTILDQLQELDRLRSEHDRAAQQQPQSSTADDERAQDGLEENKQDDCNPFPILVYHLLLADMQEAMAYGLSIHWLSEDGIYAPSSVCWAQGWLGSVSNLGASLFLSAISVTTFCTIVLGHKPSRRTLYLVVTGIWVFTYGINTAGVLCAMRSTPVVEMGEAYFMRANVWVRCVQRARPSAADLNLALITSHSAGSAPSTTPGASGPTTSG